MTSIDVLEGLANSSLHGNDCDSNPLTLEIPTKLWYNANDSHKMEYKCINGKVKIMNQECNDRRAQPFDYSIKERLSNLLQHTKAFRMDDEHADQFSFACVLQDRLNDAISYLNKHLTPPNSRDEFYLFMVYADNVFSAVEEFYKLPMINKKTLKSLKNKTYFYDSFKRAFPNIAEDEIPTDDNFFKYIRALSIAHPYETSRQTFIDSKNEDLKNRERHYSPYSLTRNDPGFPFSEDGDIEIVVYTNQKGKNKPAGFIKIILKYAVIMKFLISKYNLLLPIIKDIETLLTSKEEEWNKYAIDKNLPIEAFFIELRTIYEKCKENTFFIDEVCEQLAIKLTPGYFKNEKSLERYREAFQAILPLISEAVSLGDYNTSSHLITEITLARILENTNAPSNISYYHGKITEICGKLKFCKKDEEVLNLTTCFKGYVSFLMEEYATKWIEIDFDTMSQQEIEFLLNIARYLEYGKNCPPPRH